MSIALMLALEANAATPMAQTEHAETGTVVTSTIDPRNFVDQKMTLAQCFEMALSQNRRRNASRHAVEAAEAQHRQALASYWPQINMEAAFTRTKKDLNFVVPGAVLSTPPIGVPGVGVLPPGKIEVPAQDIKLMNRETFRSGIRGDWLIYDGGIRKGLLDQADAQLRIQEQAARKTDLEILDGVRRYYYGAVMAARILQVATDTLQRIQATSKLANEMYKRGSGKVTKADWLESRVAVEIARGFVAELEKNQLLAITALTSATGMKTPVRVWPADVDLPTTPIQANFEELVAAALNFNPDARSIEAGLRAAEGAVLFAASGHQPKVQISAEYQRLHNASKSGLATADNKNTWVAGIGVQLPLFDGKLTRHRVSEANARKSRLIEERALLNEGIAHQIGVLLNSIDAAEKQMAATRSAMSAAVENRELNARAYQHGLVELEKLIRAQITEAMMTANHLRSTYEHIELRSRLELLLGREVAAIPNDK